MSGMKLTFHEAPFWAMNSCRCDPPSLMRSHRRWYDWPRYLITLQRPYRCGLCNRRRWMLAAH